MALCLFPSAHGDSCVSSQDGFGFTPADKLARERRCGNGDARADNCDDDNDDDDDDDYADPQDVSSSLPRKLIRSVSTKLRNWCQFPSINGRELADSTRPYPVDDGTDAPPGAAAYNTFGGCGCFVLPAGKILGQTSVEAVPHSHGSRFDNVLGKTQQAVQSLPDFVTVDACRRDHHCEDNSPCPSRSQTDETADVHCKGGSCLCHQCKAVNISREVLPTLETTSTSLVQLKLEQPHSGGVSGREQCGCFVKGRIEWLGSRKGEKKGLKQVDGEKQWRLQEHHSVLPEDLLELCLARLPFSTLVRARLVCRKWRTLTMTSHFLANRERLSSRKPWLLVFGLSREGFTTGEIHGRDPSFERWHSFQAKSLSGRFLFSVASLNGLVYVIGGCSSPANCQGRLNKSAVKTHKSVLVYNALTCSWTKVCSMGAARVMPVVEAFEVRDGQIMKGSGSSNSFGSFNSEDQNNSSCRCSNLSSSKEFCCDQENTEICNPRNYDKNCVHSQMHLFCRASGVKMDCMSGDVVPALEGSNKSTKAGGLIVVGGQGVWNQPLYSAELYDASTDTWRELAKLPADHGVTCAGAICNGFFYAYSEIDKLASYDFEANVWTGIEICNPLTRLREYIPKLISCNGRILLLGVAWAFRGRGMGPGATTDRGIDKATRIIWELNPSTRAWLEISRHPDAPLDWNAIFVSEGKQIYGVEMFKIFGQVLDFVTICNFSGCDMEWRRLSRIRIGNDLEVSSCITKAAVVVHL